MLFRQLFDEKLAQYSYLIGCQATGEAIVIDPERDIDRYFALAEKEGLSIVAAADTHIHADYISGLREFAERGLKVYASAEGGEEWQYEWLLKSDTYNYQLLRDGDTFKVGNIEFTAVHTPGHTPEHISYLVYDRGAGAEDAMGVATGDFVFVGDLGRPDLLESAAGVQGVMEPSARLLYESVIKKFKQWPEFLQIWPAHGAGSACGKALGAVPVSTVGYESRYNTAIRAAEEGEDAFVKFILSGQPEPPLYFGRMKVENRGGPAVLGRLPNPLLITADELKKLANNQEIYLIDTRTWEEYSAGHVPGALSIPLNKSFTTTVGSFVEPGKPIYLIIDEIRLEEAIRDLIRIGLDEIEGYATLDVFKHYKASGGPIARSEAVDVETFKQKLERGEHVAILDVRTSAEYAEGHIPGSVNIAHTRLAVRTADVPTEEPVYVLCQSGGRATASASFLERLGRKVVALLPGFTEWAQKGGKVEKEAPVSA